MAGATLNVTVINKRMLSETEAAEYCGTPRKYFKTACPVVPLEMVKGALRYDRHALDRWIDNMAEGADALTNAAILGKL